MGSGKLSGFGGFSAPVFKDLDNLDKTIDTLHREVKSQQRQEKSEQTERTGLLSGVDRAKDGGKFEGRKVEIRQVTNGVDELCKDSRARLGEGRSTGAKVANILLGILPAVGIGVVRGLASLGATVLNAVVGGALKLLDKAVGLGEAAKQHEAATRELFGAPMEGSILSSGKPVTLGKESMPLSDALDQVRTKLGSQVSKEEMMQYVAMGERIVHGLSTAPDDAPKDKVSVKDIGGDDVKVRCNLETTRAISWYLQAKALVDNSGHGDGAFLKSGAMIAKDPGGKLFNFLQSSNNTYGRVSTHMQERSESRPQGADLNVLSTAWKGGFDGMVFAGLLGQPLQYGIEDYDNRFPSKGGSLLFDKLKPSGEKGDDVPEIFLKWEDVGTPFALGGGSNSSSNTLPDNLWNQKGSVVRFLKHTFHAHEDVSPEGYRGEKMTKGPGKEWHTKFETEVNALFKVDQGTKDKMLKHVSTYGATEMNKALDLLIGNDNGEITNGEKQRLQEFKTDFGNWLQSMGPDMGIARKGQELHVQLTGSVH